MAANSERFDGFHSMDDPVKQNVGWLAFRVGLRYSLLVVLIVLGWTLIWRPITSFSDPIAPLFNEPGYIAGENDYTYRVDPQCALLNQSAVLSFLKSTVSLTAGQKTLNDPFFMSYGCTNNPSSWAKEIEPDLTVGPALSLGIIGVIFLLLTGVFITYTQKDCNNRADRRECDTHLSHSTCWVLLPIIVFAAIWYSVAVANCVNLSDVRICTPRGGTRNAFGEPTDIHTIKLKESTVSGSISTPEEMALLTGSSCRNLIISRDGVDRWWSVEYVPNPTLKENLIRLRSSVGFVASALWLLVPALLLTDIHVYLYFVCHRLKCSSWCTNVREACWACILICFCCKPKVTTVPAAGVVPVSDVVVNLTPSAPGGSPIDS